MVRVFMRVATVLIGHGVGGVIVSVMMPPWCWTMFLV